MRFAVATLLLCVTGAAQQPVGLTQFLGLTAAQSVQVQQLNAAFTQFSNEKNARLNTVRVELAAESAKSAPDPQALGQRYIEIDSIQHELAAERAAVQAKVRALLTPEQLALLQQISAALVQTSLASDARCGGLLDSVQVPIFLSFPSTSAVSGCPTQYPISIRNYLALTDAQVSGMINLESAYSSLKAAKDERTADVEAEIRDETATPSPDVLALGVRYAELAGIAQQLTQADKDSTAAARSLLTSDQQAKLNTLVNASALTRYEFTAEVCNFLSPPPQASLSFLSPYRSGCYLN